MKTPPFLKDFIDLFFPRLCPVCQRALNRNEENICTTCLHRLPRTGVRFRVVVHGVGMLVGDAVEQPPAGRLALAGHHRVGVIFPVPHTEPQFVVHQALVQRRFSGFVPLQGLHGLSHLSFAHRQSFVLKIFHCLSPSCFQLAPLGEQSTPAGVD